MNNLELNKIYCESNLETMAKMPNNFVDYVLTSPPYNVGKNGLNGEGKKYNLHSDTLDSSNYFEQQKHLINELLRVTKYHVFYNIQLLSGNKNSVMKLMGVFADNIKEIIIWNKKNGVPAMEQGVFNSAYEYIIVFSNDQPNKRKFYDTEFRGTQNNVFTIKNTHSNPFSDVHKAIMPLDIPRYFMQLFGKEKDIWYDPYMGTGTTAVAAIEEKRKFIGSEISQEYIDLSNKRLEPYLIQPTLF
jgi:DNA modification methylase